MIASPSYPAQTPSQQEGEPVAHGLRSVYNAGTGGRCPFPEYWRVEVDEEDAKDANLMAVCAAIAGMDNRALSPAEIGEICVDAGWVRLSPAITPATLITTTIRTHQRRCQLATPPRHPLIEKHQLQGSLAESHLGPALHPDAYTQGKRPRGAVWFLQSGEGRPWKDPFIGLEVTPPAKRERKKKDPAAAVAPRRSTGSVGVGKQRRPRPSEMIEAQPAASTSTLTPPVAGGIKIRFKVAGGVPSASALREDADVCAAGPSTASASASGSGSGSRSRAQSAARASDSDDSSDSDLDLITPNTAPTVNRFRRPPPVPLALNRTSHSANFLDLFMNSPSTMPHSPDTASVPFSPFPSHSLDNTTWASHRPGDVDFESSSDSEAGDWGNQSGVMSEAMEVETVVDIDEPEVEVEQEQAMSPGETGPTGSLLANLDLNLQNQPEASTSTTPPRSSAPCDSPIALRRCRITIPPHLSLPLAPRTPGSSPMQSPTCFDEVRQESRSPTAHLSGLPAEGVPDDLVSSSMMDVDVVANGSGNGVHDVWAGEIEMPVKLEDEDEEMETTGYDESAWEAEAERQARAAAWARRCGFEAPVKRHEDDDAPSPIMELDLEDPEGTPRGSSSNTPSSRSSELPPFEADIENPLRPCDEILLGPESVGMDELDTVWGLPGTEARIEWDAKRKTPRVAKLRTQSASAAAAGGAWGGIGVGSPLILQFKGKAPGSGSGATVTRSKSARGIRPSRSAVAPPVVTIVAEPDEDEDGVGTADLERAGLWADEQEIKRMEVALPETQLSPAAGVAGGLMVDDACMSTTAISPPALILSPGSGVVESSTTVPPAVLALPTPAPSPTPLPAAISTTAVTVPIIAPKPIAPSPSPASASLPTSVSTTPDIIVVHPNKPLWPPVHASILDDIPVYRSEWEGRSGTGRDGCVLVRRIDSDFVNGTNLLLALGIPSVSTRTKHLMALPSHVPVPTLSPSGVPLQKGIPGIWIPLSAAREMARRLQPPEKQEPPGVGWLTSLLRDDLSDMFNDIAQVKRRTKTILSNARRVPDFGCQFGAGKVPLAHPSPSPTPSLIAQSSAHSRSAPNLNTFALGPPPPAVSALAAKAPLIRSAPPTPPKDDASAHVAKRRRALTMSSDTVTVSIPVKSLSTTASAGGASATATRRSARASVGGGGR